MSDQPNKITFRGMSMTADWPERIRQAQDVQTCIVNGQETGRIRYGNESDDWGADRVPCHDCGAIKGEFHVEGCDVERCPGCDGQRFNCDCEPYEDEDEAMAEDEFVHFKTARPVLGTYYERNVSFEELSSITGRLSALGLIRWRINQQGRVYFRTRAPISSQHNCTAAFTATAKGKEHLAQPRHVA